MRSARKTCKKCHKNKSAGDFNTYQFTRQDGICRYCIVCRMHQKKEDEGTAHPNKTKYPIKCKAHGLHHNCKEGR